MDNEKGKRTLTK